MKNILLINTLVFAFVASVFADGHAAEIKALQNQIDALASAVEGMFIESEVCKSLLFKAMLECESNEETKNKSVSALKAQIGLSGKSVAQDAVQLHGGMGVSDEMSIGHYLKKLIAVDALFGNSNYHLNKYSQL